MNSHPVFRLLLSALCLSCAVAFNLNVNYPRAVYKSRTNSSFGYSIAFHEYGGKTALLSGAPTEDSAYLCDLTRDIKCSKLSTNASPSSWLGATVVSRDGHAVICSPRTGGNANGDCHYGTNELSGFISVYDRNLQNFKYCSVGLSAAFSVGQLIVGGPSCEQNADPTQRFPRLGKANRKNLTALSSPGEDITTGSDDAYFSYAMTTLKINGKMDALVSSTVFHMDVIGSVKVIDISGSGARINTTIKGQQAGEFYGNSLAAVDVDGNGLEDLLVGAPHYTDYDDSDLKYEIGRVYIYYQDATSIGKSWSVLKGSSIGGRFGHAIASLGDVNGDGFNDVAISAPYEDLGNVYIYFGSASGLRSEPGQVIFGNQFSLRAFGFSLAGNADVDGNGYADLVVGAYQSDAIVYLPASPVIRMTNLSLIFEPSQISLKSRDTQRLNEKGQVVFCSSLTFCLAYTGHNVRQSTTFNVSLDLDYKQTNIRRLFFLKDNLSKKSFVLAVQKNVVQCNKEDVCVRPDIIDKLTPMETQMAIQVVNNDPLTADLPPVLNAFGPQSITNSIKIANNCGDDGVCVPDLELNAVAINKTIVEGSKEYPAVKFTVRNNKEGAFESTFNMYLPDNLLFRESKAVPCSTPTDENGPSVKCDIGNPLESGIEVEFTIYFEPKLDVSSDMRFFQFSCSVTSSNKEDSNTLANNNVTVTLDIGVQTSLTVNSRPVELGFNRTLYEQSGKNETVLPRFTSQQYEILNNGPSTILGAEVTINFVTKSAEGLHLCTLEGEPRILKGSGTCRRDQIKEGFIQIKCQINEFDYGKFDVSLAGRLAAGIDQVNLDKNVSISSDFTAAVTRLPFGMDPSRVPPVKGVAQLIVSEVNKPTSILDVQVEWWVYAASAGGAMVLLLLLTFILYKLGFFKRNRPPTSTLDTNTASAEKRGMASDDQDNDEL